MKSDARDRLGRVVRETWIRWAKMQPNPKASWLVPYDGLSEPDKEADRMIGEAVLEFVAGPRSSTIDPKFLTTISPGEFGEDLMP
jgi:hypothetical protein